MQINLTGPVEIGGFPVGERFQFEVDGDTFILRAGKVIFLTVRRETAQTSVDVVKEALMQSAGLAYVGEKKIPDSTPGDLQVMNNIINPPAKTETLPPLDSIIQMDVSKASKYRTIKRQWFDSLVSFNNKTIFEWDATVRGKIEGSSAKMLQMFLDDNVLKLQHAQPTEVPGQTGTVVSAAQAAGQWNTQVPGQTFPPQQPGGFAPQQPGGFVGGNAQVGGPPLWTQNQGTTPPDGPKFP